MCEAESTTTGIIADHKVSRCDVPSSVRLDFERMESLQGIVESVESKIDEGDPFVEGSNVSGKLAQLAFGLRESLAPHLDRQRDKDGPWAEM
jgi:hypothetical protein